MSIQYYLILIYQILYYLYLFVFIINITLFLGYTRQISWIRRLAAHGRHSRWDISNFKFFRGWARRCVLPPWKTLSIRISALSDCCITIVWRIWQGVLSKFRAKNWLLRGNEPSVLEIHFARIQTKSNVFNF